MVEVVLQNETSYFSDESRLRGLVARTVAAEEARLGVVYVSFVDDLRMADYNESHRGKEGPTDVLSFPFKEDFPQGRGGEVIIAPELAGRNVLGTETSQDNEIAHLVVHGVLHLIGYDDVTEAGLAEMEDKTQAILEAEQDEDDDEQEDDDGP